MVGTMWGPGRQTRFDFRIAMDERDRAIRELERMLVRSIETGEKPDEDHVAALNAVILGTEVDTDEAVVEIDLRSERPAE